VSDTEDTGTGEGVTPPASEVPAPLPAAETPAPALRPRGSNRHEAPEIVLNESGEVEPEVADELVEPTESVSPAASGPHTNDDGPATEAMSLRDIADMDNDGSANDDLANDGPATEDNADDGPATEAMSLQDIADVDDDSPATEAMSVQDVADVEDDDGQSTQAMSIAEVRAAKAVKEPLTEVFPRGGPVPRSGNATGTGTSSDGTGADGTASDGAASDGAADGSALDALFRDDQFQEHNDQGLMPLLPVAKPGARKPSPNSTRTPLTQAQKTMIWVAGGLVVVLFLIALYLLSFRVGEQTATREAAESVPTTTSQPVAPVDAVGPVDPGTHAWNELLGGECIDPFDSAWDTEFTVVECDDEHAAQMLVRAEIEADTPFPGVEPLASQVNTLCSAPEVLNFEVAGVVSDIQLTASFPADSAEWDAGDRTYYCFVERASGEPLPGDLALSA